MELRYESPLDGKPPRTRARAGTQNTRRLPEPQVPMDLLVRRVDARRVPPGHERPREHADDREGDEGGLLAVLDVRARVPQLKVGLLRALRVVHGCSLWQGQPSRPLRGVTPFWAVFWFSMRQQGSPRTRLRSG